MKKMLDYVVTFCNGGQMQTAKFITETEANNFAKKALKNNDYPCVIISICNGWETLKETRLFK